MQPIELPKLNANMEEATLASWLVAEGDDVEQGQALAEMVTDKANFEFESPVAGTVCKIIATEKSVLPPGYIIAFIGEPGEEVPDVSAQNQQLLDAIVEKQSLDISFDKPAASTSSANRKKVRATPAAKRMAREAKVDLADVQYTMGCDMINEATMKAYLEKQG